MVMIIYQESYVYPYIFITVYMTIMLVYCEENNDNTSPSMFTFHHSEEEQQTEDAKPGQQTESFGTGTLLI